MVGNVKIALSEKFALLLHPHADIPQFGGYVTLLWMSVPNHSIDEFVWGASASVPIDATEVGHEHDGRTEASR